MSTGTTNGYLVRRLAEAATVPCPCGESTRPLTAADGRRVLRLLHEIVERKTK